MEKKSQHRTHLGLRTGAVRKARGSRPGSRRGKPLPGDLQSSMREINKLIFVQEFERAGKHLKKLSERHPDNYEVQFRRIEVACRTDDLQALCHEYHFRALQLPQVLALQLAANLADIRLQERLAGQGAHGVDIDALINPSLGERKDVTGLSLDAERIRPARIPALSLGASGGLGSSGARTPLFLARSFRVVRNPSVADDAVPGEVPPLEDHFADAEAQMTALSESEDSAAEANPCLAKALAARDAHPSEWATWFVLGCAHEACGQLTQAIEAWSRALELNPRGVAVLATMAELQQIGALPSDATDYAGQFEAIDRYLVHGTYETHVALHKEFIERKEYALAIAALRSLGDWIQRQRGETPPEIEVLCLLGAMRAYGLDSNHAAAEACRREAENITIACKKSPKSASQIAFIGQLCEEYGLASLARVCFYSVLISREVETDLVVKTAAHCVTTHVSLSLKECLKTAYRNHHGHAEIRFCQLLCDLSLANVPLRSYMDRKNRVRDFVARNEVAQAIELLNEAFKDTQEDAETHYYMGELLSRLGVMERAKHHFSSMYDLDFLNIDSVLRYVHFLLKIREYFSVQEIARKAIEIPTVTTSQRAELHWTRATALYAENEFEEAKQDIEKSQRHDPWNMSYAVLALRLFAPPDGAGLALPHAEHIAARQAQLLSSKPELDGEALRRWLDHGRAALLRGHNEYAYLLARCAFAVNPRSEACTEFFSRAGAAFHARVAAQQLLMLLQSRKHAGLPFSLLATCVARVYAAAGEWPLVDEWIDIAIKSGVDDKFARSKLFELEALKLAMSGSQFRRAQNLLEAALDVYESGQKVPADLGVLHGYLLLTQGDIKGGMEKMQSHIGESNSIQSLYFLVKGLERAGKLTGAERETIARLFILSPTNLLEQRMIEEIHCTVGLLKEGTPVNLTC